MYLSRAQRCSGAAEAATARLDIEGGRDGWWEVGILYHDLGPEFSFEC